MAKDRPRTAADHVIEKCGGHRAVADLLGVHISRVYRYTYPTEDGGTGGTFPARQQRLLLEKAKAKGIQLEPADFFTTGAAA